MTQAYIINRYKGHIKNVFANHNPVLRGSDDIRTIIFNKDGELTGNYVGIGHISVTNKFISNNINPTSSMTTNILVRGNEWYDVWRFSYIIKSSATLDQLDNYPRSAASNASLTIFAGGSPSGSSLTYNDAWGVFSAGIVIGVGSLNSEDLYGAGTVSSEGYCAFFGGYSRLLPDASTFYDESGTKYDSAKLRYQAWFMESTDFYNTDLILTAGGKNLEDEVQDGTDVWNADGLRLGAGGNLLVPTYRLVVSQPLGNDDSCFIGGGYLGDSSSALNVYCYYSDGAKSSQVQTLDGPYPWLAACSVGSYSLFACTSGDLALFDSSFVRMPMLSSIGISVSASSSVDNHALNSNVLPAGYFFGTTKLYIFDEELLLATTPNPGASGALGVPKHGLPGDSGGYTVPMKFVSVQELYNIVYSSRPVSKSFLVSGMGEHTRVVTVSRDLDTVDPTVDKAVWDGNSIRFYMRRLSHPYADISFVVTVYNEYPDYG
jgi:hypothetical protein